MAWALYLRAMLLWNVCLCMWHDVSFSNLDRRDLAEVIAKIGSIADMLLFVMLFIRFIVQVTTNNPPR